MQVVESKILIRIHRFYPKSYRESHAAYLNELIFYAEKVM